MSDYPAGHENIDNEDEITVIPCEHCGEDAIGRIEVWDSCPTDRGEERRDYVVDVCEECYLKFMRYPNAR